MEWTFDGESLTSGPWTIKNIRPRAPRSLNLLWNDRTVDWNLDGDAEVLKRSAEEFEHFIEIFKEGE